MEDFIQAAFIRKLILDGIATVILIYMDNELRRDYHRYLQPFPCCFSGFISMCGTKMIVGIHRR